MIFLSVLNSECDGLTFTITPAAPTFSYTPDSDKDFTFTISNACPSLCIGPWNIVVITSSNYGTFEGETTSGLLFVDETGTGSLTMTLNTPPGGTFTVEASAINTICSVPLYEAVQSLNASVTTTPDLCDAEYLEDFNAVPVGTGFDDEGRIPAFTTIGQGIGYVQDASFTLGSDSYFQVVDPTPGTTLNDDYRMEASNLGGEARWESDDITISECCSDRTLSVRIFGSGVNENNIGELLNSYVKVQYEVQGSSSVDPVMIAERFGNIGGTRGGISELISYDLNACANAFGEDVTIKIIIRISNLTSSAVHGFDNLSIGQGMTVTDPELNTANVNANGNPMTSTLTVDATTHCSPEFSIDGGPYQSSNEFIVASNATYQIAIRDAVFPNCGCDCPEGNTLVVEVDNQGDCVFTLFSDYSFVPLPITLLDFQGKRHQDAIKLIWATENEINNSHFHIERSSDLNDFQSIGQVDGYGNAIESIAYEFLDQKPLNGNNYYRLKQVDFDGNYTYSNIIGVQWELQEAIIPISVFPNPVHDQLTLSNPNNYQVFISIFDLNGKKVQSIFLDRGSAETADVKHLPSGVYVLRINGDSIVSTQKIIKQ